MTDCWACAAPANLPGADGYVACPKCGLRFFASGIAPRARYDASYFDAYKGGDYHETESVRRHESRVRLALLGAVPGGSLLEIGAATGLFLDEARAAGWRVSGIEAADAAAAEARSRFGLEVTTGFVEDLELPVAAVDVVCAWHTLEHIPAPFPALQSLREALVPGGRLVVEVPNGASVLARRMGGDWAPLEPDVHVAQWNPEALGLLLQRVGFGEVTTSTVPFLTYVAGARRRLPRRALLAARQRRVLREPHPWGHELLRAVARR